MSVSAGDSGSQGRQQGDDGLASTPALPGVDPTLERHLAEVARVRSTLMARIVALESELKKSEDRVVAMQASTSWRLTAPVRGLKTGTVSVMRATRALPRTLVGLALRQARKHPRLVAVARRTLRAVPPLERLVFRMVRRLGSATPVVQTWRWAVEPDAKALALWQELLASERKVPPA